MKNLILSLLLLTGLTSFAQVPALNEIVKNNPPSSSRIGAALEATEVYTASGTDTYTVSISVLGLYSGSATYAAGDQFTIVFPNANTTTTPTLNISSEGAIDIVKADGSALAVGDLDGVVKLYYDGTDFRVVGGSSSGGTVTSVSGTTNRVTVATGTTTPVIDISPTFEALLGKVAQRIDQNNASTTSAQLATTISDETGTDKLVYSDNPTFTNLALPSTTTATTQSAADNDTSPATTAFVKANSPKVLVFALSDEASLITAGNAKLTFRMPFAMTLTTVHCSLGTAQTSGTAFTVDINESGSTILSTKITIDNNEKTSTTAATPPVISDSSLAYDAEVVLDIDTSSGTGAGCKCRMEGY